MMQFVNSYDIVIVGAGLAGLTAAMTAGRFGLKVAIVDQMAAGGQILNIEKIQNFPGFPQGIAGYDLGPMVQEQAEAAGAEFCLDTVLSLELNGTELTVHCAEHELNCRAIIVATGSHLRPLGIPGEQEFLGKGVSHCASCDGPFFTGKTVCVVGGGDSALDEAAVLTDHASRVLVIHHGEAFDAQQASIDVLAQKSNVEIIFGAELTEISGNGSVAAVKVRNVATGEFRTEPLAGVFIFVGLEPNSEFLRGVVELDNAGHIITNLHMETSVPGVFAAGDIRQGSAGQLAAVAGDGATAAVSAHRYLRAIKLP